jgi:hypothetical protein
MLRGGNKGWLVTSRDDPFMRLSLVATGWVADILLPLISRAYPYRNHQNYEKTRVSSGLRPYKKALTNTKIAIFRESYPEDKLKCDDENGILEELGRVLRGTPIGELPRLKSCRLKGGALIYYMRRRTVWSMDRQSY